ncbi:MAG TPA: carbamoyltransferase C-terminal domain-containing protein [Solirubrobacteraceae bacterium]|jgi:carbamoyltransferase|nr:carbamoyltransferase C-terminal domain-containing protein [Solirubrobacteraceae bacterium]
MILGVNAPPTGWHDPAACLVAHDGTLLAFCEEERLSRDKHAERSGPLHAVRYCLEQAGAQLGDVDLVAVGWDVPRTAPLYGHEWTLEGTPAWLERYLGWRCSAHDMPEVRFVGHHLAHATIAFHASDFDHAAVLVVDGNGDDESISIYRADRERGLVRARVWSRSHSLGYMYDAACRFAGFGPLQAGKLMGLSAYGRAADVEPWDLLPGGEPRAPGGVDDGDGFNRYIHAWTARLNELAGGLRPSRGRQELHLDELAVQAAVSAQEAVERAVLRLAATARELAGTDNLCLAGGVALNCKANGLLSGPVFAPPAPHDAGTALGAAWHVAPPRRPAQRMSAFLGPAPGVEANGALDGLHREALSLERVCDALAAGCCGALVQGPGEIGPRALGHRSIVADPSDAAMHRRLNDIKGRERWRPFGAAALSSRAGALWEPRPRLSDYMLAGTPVSDAAREQLPAAVHVDGTTRPQELDPASGDVLAELLVQWGDRAGGALINTSFNGPGEPIVSSAADAIAAFRRLGLDFLVIDDELVAAGPAWWRGPGC